MTQLLSSVGPASLGGGGGGNGSQRWSALRGVRARQLRGPGAPPPRWHTVNTCARPCQRAMRTARPRPAHWHTKCRVCPRLPFGAVQEIE
jgi:hypothetical protein